MHKKGYLYLENGQFFEGISFGSEKNIKGEVIFNTGMTGYPESFTDPSYHRQILTMTYPLIGNYGVPKWSKNPLNSLYESDTVQIRGLIVSNYVASSSHHQAASNLSDWLKKHNIPALTGIDTRTLTKILRKKGVMKAILSFEKRKPHRKDFVDINKDNLVKSVSCKTPQIYGDGKITLLFIDLGLKYNQLKLLVRNNVRVIRVPWDYDPFTNKKTYNFDGIMISNGPGNPKKAKKTISVVKEAIKRKIPILGICLGNQILALASGADTYKLKYGHRSQNQPVQDTISSKCYITTQNHGYCVDQSTLNNNWMSWFVNLNDGTNEGIKHVRLPFYSVQFHPEATPGPKDTQWIIPFFLKRLKKWKKQKK